MINQENSRILSNFRKFSISKRFVVLLTSVMLLIYSCGDPLPLHELGDAKIAINKAAMLGASSFAPKKLEESRKALYIAHDFVAKEKNEDAKKNAAIAKKLAEDAEIITVTHIAKNTAKDAVDTASSHYDSAVEANAEMFASTELKKSKAFLDEAKAKLKETEDVLVEADKKKETDHKKYKQVQEMAKETEDKAKEADAGALATRKICAEQVPSIKASIRDVENIILVAESLGAKRHAAQKVQTARSKASSAKSLTSDMMLKKALKDLSEAKINADEALIIAKMVRSQEKLEEADSVIARASKSIAAKKKMDQLNASKESLTSAKKSHGEKRYDDSYSQSEESIRLARIVIDTEAEMIAERQRKAEEERLRKLREKQGKEGIYAQRKRTQELIDFWDILLKNSKVHTVKWVRRAKQTLWRISVRYYKDARLWPRIFRVNKDQIKDPDLIYPKQRFLVPKKSLKIPADLEPLKDLQKKLKELDAQIKAEKSRGQ